MEIVPYGGWQRCARFQVGDKELVVTLEVGPRIIRFGYVGGSNELVEYPADMGKSGGLEYHSYGGHRLWIAPEEHPKTMHSDNEPVEYSQDGEWHCFLAPPEKWLVRKEIRLRIDEKRDAVQIEHRIHNLDVYDKRFAPWALTVMAVGGQCLFPQAPFVPHTEDVLPARPMVLWGYTDMGDPRWTWGAKVVRLCHDGKLGPQKIGALVQQGYAAYANGGVVFLKRFPFEPEAEYPDFGCNFETFTRQDMLEVESLGPLQDVAPGSFAGHRETWYLTRGTPPENDMDCAAWLEEMARTRPLID